MTGDHLPPARALPAPPTNAQCSHATMSHAARDCGAQAPSARQRLAGAPYGSSFELPPVFYLNDRGVGGDSGVPQLTLHDCCAHEEALLYGAVSSMVYSAHASLVCAPGVPGGRSLGAHLQTAREGGILIGHPFNAARDAATKKTADMARALWSQTAMWTACAPKLAPGQTHHPKYLLLCYERFLRVVLMSGNLCGFEWHDNTNSMFAQDFPRKGAPAPPAEFEAALLRFFQELSSKGGCDVARLVRHLALYDFSSAKAVLLVSAPGARDASARFGHLGLRAALLEEAAALQPAAAAAAASSSSVLVAQCSSYGSLKTFVPDFVSSCSGAAAPSVAAPTKKRARDARSAAAAHAGAAATAAASGAQLAATPLLCCLWPTAGAVRASARGWDGGADFPTKANTLQEALSRRLLHVFAYPDALRASHQRSLVHGKFLLACRAARQNDDDGDDASLPGGAEVDWLVTGSHNVSPAAWGGAVARNGNCTASNYELSVLLTPRRFAAGSALEAQLVAAGRLPPSRFTVALLPRADAGASDGGGGGGTAAMMMPAVRFFAQFGGADAVERARERVVVTAGATGDVLVPLPIPFRLPFASGAQEALAAYTAAADVPFCGDGWQGAEAAFAAADHTGRTHEQAKGSNRFAKR